MELNLSSELQTKLQALATHQGKNSETLAVEAIERLVEHDEWFLREVEKGELAADRGELLSHAAVRQAMTQRFDR